MKPVVTVILSASVAVCLTSAVCRAENDQKMSAFRISAEVLHQLRRCWVPPEGTGAPLVTVDFHLKRDGTLARDPIVLPVDPADLQNAQFQLAAKSVMDAVRTCTPLRLPADQYDIWEKVEVEFYQKRQRLGVRLDALQPSAGAKIPSSQHNPNTGN